jgi:hypothetical protein
VTSNYQGISLLSTSYRILSNILTRLILYADEIIGDHQCGFRHNRFCSSFFLPVSIQDFNKLTMFIHLLLQLVSGTCAHHQEAFT